MSVVHRTDVRCRITHRWCTWIARTALVKFLLYVDNPGGAIDDVSLQDDLDPAFSYVPGSIHYDNSVASCAATDCSAAEEAAILAAVDTGTNGSDGVDGDVVSFVGGVTDAGNQTQTNAQLNVQANRVWAMSITVRMR